MEKGKKDKVKDVAFADKAKVTAYFERGILKEFHDDLVNENEALGLNPRDRRGPKAGKTLSDLLVTLTRVWQTNDSVRALVRKSWGMEKVGK